MRVVGEHFLNVREDFVYNKYTDSKTRKNKVSFLTRYEKCPCTRDEVSNALLQYLNAGEAFQTNPDAWCRQCKCDSYCLERIREAVGAGEMS